jgi:hypothetical protein
MINSRIITFDYIAKKLLYEIWFLVLYGQFGQQNKILQKTLFSKIKIWNRFFRFVST